jgi:hypothetical protein
MVRGNRTPPATALPAPKDCLDCTISRLSNHRLCLRHWQAFIFWMVGRRGAEYRRATPVERDHMVRDWIDSGGPSERNSATGSAGRSQM